MRERKKKKKQKKQQLSSSSFLQTTLLFLASARPISKLEATFFRAQRQRPGALHAPGGTGEVAPRHERFEKAGETFEKSSQTNLSLSLSTSPISSQKNSPSKKKTV